MPIPEDEFERTIIISEPAADETAARDVIGHYLMVAKGSEEPRRVELASGPLSIGRDPRQSLVLVDTEISRLHARVSLTDGAAIVEDVNSTNGTFLNGQRLTAAAKLKEGDVIRLGGHTLTYERRSRRDVERSSGLDRDLQKARKYVFSLLPSPLTSGPVLAEWRFVPSAQLGGDAFGYYWLDEDTFVFYLIDVSGHGVGSAMHSVTVLNVLKQRALPQVRFDRPAEVLTSLNERFQMDGHGGLFFTMWYGVYAVSRRSLTYSSAGHHPASMVSAGKGAISALGEPALMIGAMTGVQYETLETTVAPGSSLYLYSDGVYEVTTTEGQDWSLADFERLILQPQMAGAPESERLLQAVKAVTGGGSLSDDFSLVVVTFP